MNVDQDPSSDSFVNGGVSTRRSSSGTPTAATGGANNGGPPTAARTGRNVTGLTTDKGHNAAARATTTTTTRSTAENDNNRQDAAPLQQGGSARNAVQSRQRVREVAAAPRVLRPRTGGAASAGSPETGRQAKAGGASIPAGARESSRKRDAPAADAAPSGKPNKKRQKASQPKQPEIRDSADSSCTALDGADELGVRQEPAPRQLKATAPPASNEANWDDSSLPDAEVQEPVPPQSPTSPAGQQDAPLDDGASSAPRADASASPTDNRLDEACSHHTQDGALSHEKIACVYHIPHQEEPTTQAREGATPTPSETIQFIVDVLGDKRAEKFLTKRAFRSADDSCVGNAGNRIEVKIGKEQGVAVPRHVHCASNYELCSLLLVVSNTSQGKRTARPSWRS